MDYNQFAQPWVVERSWLMPMLRNFQRVHEVSRFFWRRVDDFREIVWNLCEICGLCGFEALCWVLLCFGSFESLLKQNLTDEEVFVRPLKMLVCNFEPRGCGFRCSKCPRCCVWLGFFRPSQRRMYLGLRCAASDDLVLWLRCAKPPAGESSPVSSVPWISWVLLIREAFG